MTQNAKCKDITCLFRICNFQFESEEEEEEDDENTGPVRTPKSKIQKFLYDITVNSESEDEGSASDVSAFFSIQIPSGAAKDKEVPQFTSMEDYHPPMDIMQQLAVVAADDQSLYSVSDYEESLSSVSDFEDEEEAVEVERRESDQDAVQRLRKLQIPTIMITSSDVSDMVTAIEGKTEITSYVKNHEHCSNLSKLL